MSLIICDKVNVWFTITSQLFKEHTQRRPVMRLMCMICIISMMASINVNNFKSTEDAIGWQSDMTGWHGTTDNLIRIADGTEHSTNKFWWSKRWPCCPEWHVDLHRRQLMLWITGVPIHIRDIFIKLYCTFNAPWNDRLLVWGIVITSQCISIVRLKTGSSLRIIHSVLFLVYIYGFGKSHVMRNEQIKCSVNDIDVLSVQNNQIITMIIKMQILYFEISWSIWQHEQKWYR